MMCAPTGLSNPAPAALRFAAHVAYLLGGLHSFPWLSLAVISCSSHLQHPGVPTDAHTSHSQFKTLSPFPEVLLGNLVLLHTVNYLAFLKKVCGCLSESP